MIIEVILELEDDSAGENVINFADYAKRRYVPADAWLWDANVIPLTHCEIIDLAERRAAR